MIRCADCRHWDPQGEHPDGECRRIVSRPMVEKMTGSGFEYAGDATPEEAPRLGAYVQPDVPSFGASVRTVAEFGCVLGEERT
jgi:hypothetical protein